MSRASRAKHADAASYDAVAAEFDRWSERTTFRLVAGLLERVAAAPGERVLDLGCGSGALARGLAARAQRSGAVVGLDHSIGMLARARGIQCELKGGVVLVRADAEELPFANESFDAVLSLFALLHFPAPERALEEAWRVMRAGGRLVLGVGLAPPLGTAGLRYVVRRVAERLAVRFGRRVEGAELLGRLLEAREDRESSETLPPPVALPGVLTTPRDVVDAVRGAGFVGVRRDHLWGELVLEDPEELWDLVTTFSSPARALRDADETQWRTLRRRFLERCQRGARRARLVYRYGAFMVSGRRPDAAAPHSR